MQAINWQPMQLALSLLTRIPAGVQGQHSPEFSAKALGQSVNWYAAVGALIGLLLAALAESLMQLGSPLELSAALILLLWVGLTGGLHMDGLADAADAWIGGMGNKDKTLRILKDPHIGVFGVLAVVFILLLKWACLLALLRAEQKTDNSSLIWMALILAPIIGRGLIQLCFISMAYISPGGMGASQARHCQPRALIMNVVIVGLMLLFTIGFSAGWLKALLVMALLTTCFIVYARALNKRLGGFSGDFAGAITEIGEALFLLLLLV